jgi:type II secretory pathway pseudopilin PulG
MKGRWPRHRAQAGTTLVELVVSVAILSLALLLLVGAFSSGVIQATLVKRTTASNGVVEFELERIAAAAYSTPPQPYSECFATDTAASPVPVGFQAPCPAGSALRADVSEADVQPGLQQWTVSVITYPALSPVGAPVSVYKTRR